MKKSNKRDEPVVRRTYKFSKQKKALFLSLQRKGESQYDMLLRLADYIETIDLQDDPPIWTHQFEFPEKTFDTLQKRMAQSSDRPEKILSRAAKAMKEADVKAGFEFEPKSPLSF